MWLEAMSVGGHFFDDGPGHIPFAAQVDEFSGDEKGSFEAKFLEDGIGVFIVVEIAIVEGEDDRFGGKFLFVGNGAGEIVEVNRRVAIVV